MKKTMIIALCALSSLTVAAQSRWSLTPEAGLAAVNCHQGAGTGWRAGAKVGVGVDYKLNPDWLGIHTGLYYANRGYSLGPFLMGENTEDYEWMSLAKGSLTRHYLQLPVMADFSWNVGGDTRLHAGIGMYAAIAVANKSDWGDVIRVSNRPDMPTGTGGLGYYEDGYYGSHFFPDGTKAPFRDLNAFDWGATASVGVETGNWVMTLGYDLSLGKEGPGFQIDGLYSGLYESRSIGANYHTVSLSVGYKFHL